MEIFDQNKKYINGPINVIRLKGSVNGTKKIIYLFMDQHHPLHIQTECDNVYSDSIQKYFSENFQKLSKTKKIYDFFLEIRPTEIQNISRGYDYPAISNLTEIYIIEVWKLFRKIFEFDDQKNKVSLSKYFTNIRLHYMDVRDYFKNSNKGNLINLFSGIIGPISSMWTNQYINTENLDRVTLNIQDFKIFCQFIRENITTLISGKPLTTTKTKIIKPKKLNKVWNEEILYLLNKMYHSYKNDNVKKNLNKQFFIVREDMTQLIKECDNITNNINQISNFVDANINKLNSGEFGSSYGITRSEIRNILTNLNNMIERLYTMFIVIFSRFMDIYFLRRFLDKDYITNAITYTGSAHSCTYIEILTQEFDFVITHTSYSTISDLSELNRVVKTKKSIELDEIFYPLTLSQCSELSNFPKNFE
ncbi:hypothetical protein mvi_754 [Megavirus vitis]|uniref:Uncharacterized protein n=1 Tax=Bandra megavirus TaxID=2071566 RepID=A0A2K9V952_9VIRU|nr:hypothetical protein [Bandra megavirus]AVL94114.1 hypothetical protein mvi_754 [Megavirus vitis]